MSVTGFAAGDLMRHYDAQYACYQELYYRVKHAASRLTPGQLEDPGVQADVKGKIDEVQLIAENMNTTLQKMQQCPRYILGRYAFKQSNAEYEISRLRDSVKPVFKDWPKLYRKVNGLAYLYLSPRECAQTVLRVNKLWRGECLEMHRQWKCVNEVEILANILLTEDQVEEVRTVHSFWNRHQSDDILSIQYFERQRSCTESFLLEVIRKQEPDEAQVAMLIDKISKLPNPGRLPQSAIKVLDTYQAIRLVSYAATERDRTCMLEDVALEWPGKGASAELLLAIAAEIPCSEIRSKIQEKIVDSFLKQGDFTKAYHLACKIAKSTIRANACFRVYDTLCNTLDDLYRTGNIQGALRMIAEHPEQLTNVPLKSERLFLLLQRIQLQAEGRHDQKNPRSAEFADQARGVVPKCLRFGLGSKVALEVARARISNAEAVEVVGRSRSSPASRDSVSAKAPASRDRFSAGAVSSRESARAPEPLTPLQLREENAIERQAQEYLQRMSAASARRVPLEESKNREDQGYERVRGFARGDASLRQEVVSQGRREPQPFMRGSDDDSSSAVALPLRADRRESGSVRDPAQLRNSQRDAAKETNRVEEEARKYLQWIEAANKRPS